MVGDGTSLAPPRKINVQKFAESRGPELHALHSIVSTRLGNDFRSKPNKRRRTTSHDNQASKKRHRKRRRTLVRSEGGKSGAVSEKLPRRVRRRLELKKNPETGFVTSGDGTRRLRTHVWHAKRFTMTKLWGFYLPMGLHGRGRGSRAVLKWLRSGAVVHDASYFVAVQLEGSEDSLMSVLEMALAPSPSSQPKDVLASIHSGAIYGTAMLHHVGASASRAIAPVTYMWRPRHLRSRQISANDGNPEACDEPQSSEYCSSFRQLWVWIHAAAFNEGYDALKFACQKQMNGSGVLINCFSLEGKLVRLDVMGLKAFQLLQKTIEPISCDLNNALEGDRDLKLYSGLENEENIPLHSVLSLTVKDPRVLPKGIDVPNSVPQTKVNNFLGISENKNETSVCSNPEGTSTSSDDMNLWDISKVSPPVEENVLCLEKHDSRMDSFFINDPKSGQLRTSTEVQGLRSCPVLLLKNNSQTCYLKGWSVVLPLSWVKAFWIPFVLNGAHAIGLREKRWIACEVGLPHFPSDFPDCEAYSSSITAAGNALDQKAKQAPPAVRPFKVPIPPPWNTVRDAFDKEPTAVLNNQNASEGLVDGDSKCGDFDLTSTNGCGGLFHAVFGRTSVFLTDFLKEIHCDCLSLFPQAFNRETETLEPMKYENTLCQSQIRFEQIASAHTLCFVRVLLHAYKEGVFEEGAVVCAPVLSDISLWTTRSDGIEGGLQIPQSLVRSCFTEERPGQWKLQVPHDPEVRKAHRWPIGFVTTGFVRGSKKPVAEAYCEAVLLANLREEQWKEEMPKKQKRREEIYVLVRNLRSSAYRLALASIVLEKQEDDIEFL